MSKRKNPQKESIPENKTLECESSDSKDITVEDLMKENEQANSCSEVLDLQKQLSELKDSHLRLMAEYDNFRKRTIKEKADLIKTGGERVLTHFLEVLDDFDRAKEHIKEDSSPAAVLEGIELIHKKLVSVMKSQGVSEIGSIGQVFDPDIHEAVAMVPTEDPEQKGVVVDCIKKGYQLHDKVIRHPKVVVGQ